MSSPVRQIHARTGEALNIRVVAEMIHNQSPGASTHRYAPPLEN